MTPTGTFSPLERVWVRGMEFGGATSDEELVSWTVFFQKDVQSKTISVSNWTNLTELSITRRTFWLAES